MPGSSPLKTHHRGDPAQSTADIAQVGDPQAFSALTEPYRRELQVHCYRLLGSLEDAEDLVQETLLRAWRRRDTYQGRASLRAWLYKIATNACLDALDHHSRRSLPYVVSLDSEPNEGLAPPVADTIWLEPFPTQQLVDLDSNPEAHFTVNESIRLAFLVALHGLPPRQRAVLILRDVLDWEINEIAELLDTTVSAANSALHRARATLSQTYQGAEPDATWASDDDEATQRLLAQYVQAWEGSDIAGLTELLRDDALLSMPPSPSWYRGRSAVIAIMKGMAFTGDAHNRWRMLPTTANDHHAFAFYERDERQGNYPAFGLQVLTIRGGLIADIIAFGGQSIVGRFGLPLALDP